MEFHLQILHGFADMLLEQAVNLKCSNNYVDEAMCLDRCLKKATSFI